MGGDRLFRATVIFALAMIAYTANGRMLRWGDTVPARYLPFSILQDGNFRLDRFPEVYRQGTKAYWVKQRQGVWISAYPVGAAIAALPLYAPAILTGTLTSADDNGCRRMEKVSASTLVAASAAFVYLTLAMLVSEPLALVVTAGYALGTSSMSVTSGGLWQHGPAQLSLAVGIFLLVKAREGRDGLAAAAGFPLAFAFVCRPTNLLLFLPLAVYVLHAHRRVAIGFAAAASLPFLFQLAYNLTYYGQPIWFQFSLADKMRWHTAGPLETLPGLLLSPGRGLLFYSPFLLFGVAGLALSLRRGGDKLLWAFGAGIVLSLALLSRWYNWWGGATFGPRLTSDLTPLLALGIYPCAEALRRSTALRVLFGAALAWSIFAHVAGAYWVDNRWNVNLVGNIQRNMWKWTDNQAVDAVADVAAGVAERLPWRTVALDTKLAEGLARRAEKDKRHDGDWIALRDLYRNAGDAERAKSIEELRRSRFTPSIALDVHYDDQLTLVGIDQRRLGPTELEVTYYWRADRRLPEDYALLTRLRGRGCAFTSEFVLGSPDYTTRRWGAGETFKVTDRLLPPSIPERGCRLQVGVWAPQSRKKLYARRLPVWNRWASVLRVEPAGAISPAR